MYRPYSPLVNKTTQIFVDQEGLELILELSDGPNDPLFISFEGDKTYEWTIRNQHGFYKDTFDLPQGSYNMTLSSGSGHKKLIMGTYKTGEQSYLLYNSLISGNL